MPRTYTVLFHTRGQDHFEPLYFKAVSADGAEDDLIEAFRYKEKEDETTV